MDCKLQEIIQEAKAEPVLVKICQILEGMLVDSDKKLEEQSARITELEEKVSNFGKVFSRDRHDCTSKRVRRPERTIVKHWNV